MNTYYPDKWVMLKITSRAHGVIYKILASWYGGFAGSNSWKLSSGTAGAFQDPNTPEVILFPQESGSTYACHKSIYGMSGYTAGVLSTWQDQLKDSDNIIEILDENFDIDLLNKI